MLSKSTRNKYKTKSTTQKKNKNTKKSISKSISRSKSRSLYKKNTKNSNDKNNSNDSNNFIEISNNNIVSISMRFTTNRFYTNPKTARRIIRKPLIEDRIIEFIDDHIKSIVKNGNILSKELLQFLDIDLFKAKPNDECICNNFKSYKKLNALNTFNESCSCSNLTPQKPPIHSQSKHLNTKNFIIQCNDYINDDETDNNLLITSNKDKNFKPFIKFRFQTENYYFLEIDHFTITTLIHRYINQYLPHNTLILRTTGICKKSSLIGNNHMAYNLMGFPEMIDASEYFDTLLNDEQYDDNTRYKLITNFLLQVILIHGTLQTIMEFFHGNYTIDNMHVKKLDTQLHPFLDYNIYGKPVKIKNLGFVIIINNFEYSSFSLKSLDSKVKYRFLPELSNYGLIVNKIIKKYGNINYNNIHKHMQKYRNNNSSDFDLNFNKLNIIFPGKYVIRNSELDILRYSGLSVFSDLDLYIFFITLLDNENIINYFKKTRLYNTITGFMSDSFLTELFNILQNNNHKKHIITASKAMNIVIKILKTNNEPINSIWNNDYLKTLNILNYKLFRNIDIHD